jgi:hypothetical protein
MPGKDPETRVIGGNEYTVHPHGAIKGRSILLRLAKIVGGALTGITEANAADKLGDLLGNLTEADLTFLCDEFSAKTLVSVGDGQVQLNKVFDAHFQDAYLEMLQWLRMCVEVNFGSFFRGARGALKSAVSPEKGTSKAG